MTQGSVSEAISLTGVNSVYQNSVPWPGTITLSFIEGQLPYFYENFDHAGFIGVDIVRDAQGNPVLDANGNTITHSWHEPGALGTFDQAQMDTVLHAALGNMQYLGFNQITQSSIQYVPYDINDINVPEITFGLLDFNSEKAGAVTFTVGSESTPLWSDLLLNAVEPGMEGDVWVFKSNWNSYATYTHELGHALGLYHTFNDVDPFDTKHTTPSYPEDSTKFSVMAYASHPGEARDPVEWQLHDIAALQFLYGAGAANAGNTSYSQFTDPDGQDRIFSIWDSGGTDTIDASSYAKSYIDLRPGFFSSIGPYALSDHTVNGGYNAGRINDDLTVALGTGGALGRENVSVAFGAYIENGTGGQQSDVIVGNQFSNILKGNGGNDMLFADGFAIQHGNDQLVVQGLPTTGLQFDPTLGAADANYGKIDKGVYEDASSTLSPNTPERDKQHDMLEGGAGNDLLVGGWGQDKIDGGDNNDLLFGDRGDDQLVGGAGTDKLFGEDDDDRLDGGAGTDQVFGGSGNDHLVANMDNADDTLDGGSGDDTVIYQYDHGDSIIEVVNDPFLAGTGLHPRADAGDFGLNISGAASDPSGASGNFGTDTLTSIENAAVEAGDGNDTLILSDDSELRYLDYVDMGSQADDGLDKIDLSGVTRNSFVDLTKGTVTITQSVLPSWVPNLISNIFTSDNTLSVRHAEKAVGGSGNDVMHGSSGKRDSGAGFSALVGGAGDDRLVAAGWETHLTGGTGDDSFYLGSGTWIEDGEAGDHASYGGINLYGGVQQWWMEGGTAYAGQISTLLTAFPVIGSELLYTASFFIDQNWMKFASYKLADDGTLLMNLGWGQAGSAAVKDYNLNLDTGAGSAGLAVFAASRAGGGTAGAASAGLTHFINLALKAGFGHGMPGFDPLVLDLGGDGFNLTTEANSNVFFEFDSDGFGEHTGWVQASDGFLVRDANANGTIDNVGEMFGNATTGGFDVLAGYDNNADGAITAADSVFASLRVWQDLDQDGVTDAGELKSLADLGIVSISLTHAAPSQPTLVGGNVVAQVGGFTRANGTTGSIGDVELTINDAHSKWLGDSTVDSVAAALPQLAGAGELKNLRVAMSSDSTLKAQVGAFAASNSTDLSVLEGDAEDILYRWAGVGGVVATALGSDGFDTRKLAFLEKYSGYALMPRDAGGAIQLDNLDEVEALWNDQLTRLTLRLVVQGPLATVFGGLTYREDLDLLVADGPNALADVLHRVIAGLPSDATAAAADWDAWAPLLGAVSEGMVRSDANLVRSDFLFEQLLRAADGVTQPLSLQALADALGIADTRVGTSGNDTLARGTAGDTAIYYGDGGNDVFNGGTGQDVYIFGRDVGHATINDNEPNPAGDRIRFAFLNQADVTLARDGNDLLITVTATGETVRVTGQFAPVVPLGSDVLLSSDKGIEDIQFADGSIMEIPEIMAAVGKGSDGDDHMVGTMHSDVFTGGKGNDLLEGGDDADLYVFNRGDGNDVIHDQQSTPLLRAADMLVFGDDIAPEDLTWSRGGANGDDLVITVADGGGSMTISGQFAYTSLGYNGALAPNSRIEAFAFREYGDSFSNRDIQQQLIAQDTTGGNDTTRGFGDDDTFAASAGNDVLIGMDGADTYDWGAGAGNDIVREQAQYIDVNVGLGGISLTVRADVVQFDASIDPAHLVFSRDYDTDDLTITNTNTGETLTVDGQFNSFQTGVLGPQWFDRVEWFAFADNSAYSWQDVETMVTTGSSGNDRLRGDILADHMVGGLGNDLLSGGGGGDTYVFNAGDGHDTIFDDNQTLIGDGFLTADQTIDTVELGAGIDPADVVFSRNGSSITLTFGTSGDAITLQGQDDYIQTGVFGAIPTSRIEQVKFHDGTIWTWQDINQKMIAAQTTAGNDVTEGFTLADRFEKSAGDDILRGGDSGDTYVFGVGAGHDRIEESVSNVLYGDDDSVEFDSTVAPADVSVARDGNDLILSLTSGDSLRIAGEFDLQTLYTWTDVENFRFADGTVWSKADIQQKLLQSTSGDDHLVGFYSSDDLDGGAGNDILEGGDGSDTYHFDRGDGNDEIRESVTEVNVGDFDQVVFGPTLLPEDLTVARDGNDLVLTVADTGETLRVTGQFNFNAWFAWNDVELFKFANGTQWTDVDIATRLTGGTSGDDHLVGTFRSDTLDGKEGNDLLEGGDGSDIYLFGRGYGHDEIRESLTDANLGEDDEVRFGANITLADLGFTRDGDNLVISINGTDDTLTLTGEFTYSFPYTWNDVERFTFADGSYITKDQISAIVLTGTSGNDHIIGFGSNDTLDGAGGDDILEGMDGSDTYRFGVGDGHDTVMETLTDGRTSEFDTLAFKQGVAPADVTVTRDGADAIFTLASGDSIRVVGQFNEGYNEFLSYNDVEQATFADGTVWDKVEIDRRSIHSTSGDDVMYGSRYEQTYDGGAGNDTISAGNANDVLIGGTGNDLLQGDGGDDTYLYNLGDGDDVINDYNYGNDGADKIVFGAGIAPGDLRFSNNPADATEVVISFANAAGSIRIQHQWWGDAGIESLQFADGTVWNQDQIAAAWIAGQATPGDDTVFGSGGNDIVNGGAGNDHLLPGGGDDLITGGTGNDRLEGDAGNDTYVYNLGDGDDVVFDYNWNNDQSDKIVFGAGITPANIRLGNNGNNVDVKITFDGSAGSIVLQNQWWGDAGIESFEFADGTIWDQNQIAAAWVAGQTTSGDDTIYGSPYGGALDAGSGNDHVITGDNDDVITGGVGNDRLESGYGNDRYVYNLGDGHDVIRDYSWNNDQADRIVFGAGITPDDVLIDAASDGSIRFTFKDAAGSIKIENQNWGDAGIEYVDFANGTTWDLSQINAQISRATTGADTLTADPAGEELWALEGDDRINGSAEADSLHGQAGADTIFGGGGDDIVDGGAGDDTLFGDNDPASALTIVGSNLIVNGSFETGTVTGGGGWGNSVSSMTGWDKANGQGYEQVYSGYGGVNATDGSFWLDMDAGGGSGSNMDISQTVSGLTAGDTMALSFDHANRTSATNGAFEVYWNGTLIATIDQTGTTMVTTTIAVTTIDGDNVVRFKGVGDEDNTGASLDNVQLHATEASSLAGGDDMLTGGAGDDTIDGGSGADIAVYSGLSTDYSVTANQDGSYTVEDLISDRDGVDTLNGIETLRFTDGDFDPLGLSGGEPQAMRFMALGQPSGAPLASGQEAESQDSVVGDADALNWVDDWSFDDGRVGRFDQMGDRLGRAFDLPRRVMAIDSLGPDPRVPAPISASASMLAQGMASFTVTPAGEITGGHRRDVNERDLWIAQHRDGVGPIHPFEIAA